MDKNKKKALLKILVFYELYNGKDFVQIEA
jgi:hypothetical protein